MIERVYRGMGSSRLLAFFPTVSFCFSGSAQTMVITARICIYLVKFVNRVMKEELPFILLTPLEHTLIQHMRTQTQQKYGIISVEYICSNCFFSCGVNIQYEAITLPKSLIACLFPADHKHPSYECVSR